MPNNTSNEGQKTTDAGDGKTGTPPTPARTGGRAPAPVGRQAGAVRPATTPPKGAAVKQNVDSALTGDAVKTKELLSKEAQVSYFIPLGFGEKKGAYETVSINGYKLTIAKGVRVTIPESMARLLDENLGIQEEIGLDQRLDLGEKDKQDALA